MSPLYFIRHVPRYRTVSKHTSYAGLPANVRIAAELIIEGLIRFCQQFIPGCLFCGIRPDSGAEDPDAAGSAAEGKPWITVEKSIRKRNRNPEHIRMCHEQLQTIMIYLYGQGYHMILSKGDREKRQ